MKWLPGCMLLLLAASSAFAEPATSDVAGGFDLGLGVIDSDFYTAANAYFSYRAETLQLGAQLPLRLMLTGDQGVRIRKQDWDEASDFTRLLRGMRHPAFLFDGRSFLDHEVTPRFPDGLTVFDAYGQWRNHSSGNIGRLRTKVLVILHEDTPQKRAAIDEIRSAWKAATHDHSVLLVSQAAEISF